MKSLRLAATKVKTNGTYSFHNGFEIVHFTSYRKYYAALKEHQRFLNACIKIKRRRLFEAVIDDDLHLVNQITSDLLRAEKYAKYQTGYTGIVFLNHALIDYRPDV